MLDQNSNNVYTFNTMHCKVLSTVSFVRCYNCTLGSRLYNVGFIVSWLTNDHFVKNFRSFSLVVRFIIQVNRVHVTNAF